MHRQAESTVSCGIVDEFIVQRGIAVHEFGKHIGVAFTGEEEGPPQPLKRAAQLLKTVSSSARQSFPMSAQT